MSTNLKITIGITYLISLSILLYFVFSFLDLTRLSDYSYIKENTKSLIEFKDNNTTSFVITFYLFVIVWILLLGFGSPISIVCGFIFGKYIGTLICLTSFTMGCSLLYLLANAYFKNLVEKYLENKIDKLKTLFNKNELLYFMLFRFVGGGGIPFGIQNVLPVIFNMRFKNYVYATFLGLIPTTFIICSIGSGIESIIENNESPTIFDAILNPDIYIPLLSFLTILIISYFIKNKIFKDNN
tara:strand:- start:2226 stop:2948 length:723 start_codon:yes stop_codon:yes gene_type:complete